jgi:hypothetical protein
MANKAVYSLVIFCFKVYKKQHAVEQSALTCEGPDYPDYLDVCCDGFRSGSVCEESFENVIATIPGMEDSLNCQLLCQVVPPVSCGRIVKEIQRNRLNLTWD